MLQQLPPMKISVPKAVTKSNDAGIQVKAKRYEIHFGKIA